MKNQDCTPKEISAEDFNRLFELANAQPWIKQKSSQLDELWSFCETEEQKELLLGLLTRFHHVSSEKHDADIQNLLNQIVNIWKCDTSNTLIGSITGENHADSSKMIAYSVKVELAKLGKWGTYNFPDGLKQILASADKFPNIVIVDDFAGTGNSIKKKINYLRDDAKTKINVRVGLLTAMTEAIHELKEVADEVYCVNQLEKGISSFFSGEELIKATATMETLEGRLKSNIGRMKLNNYRFGYGRSESLHISDKGNPPNNNFPIFWWPKIKHVVTSRKVLAPRI